MLYYLAQHMLLNCQGSQQFVSIAIFSLTTPHHFLDPSTIRKGVHKDIGSQLSALASLTILWSVLHAHLLI
jgi:hypothetical protein